MKIHACKSFQINFANTTISAPIKNTLIKTSPFVKPCCITGIVPDAMHWVVEASNGLQRNSMFFKIFLNRSGSLVATLRLYHACQEVQIIAVICCRHKQLGSVRQWTQAKLQNTTCCQTYQIFFKICMKTRPFFKIIFARHFILGNKPLRCLFPFALL